LQIFPRSEQKRGDENFKYNLRPCSSNLVLSVGVPTMKVDSWMESGIPNEIILQQKSKGEVVSEKVGLFFWKA
jgi:hypothetical protein